MVVFTVQRITVDILGNVFSDVTRCTAFIQVLAVKAVFGCATLVSILFHGIPTHDVNNLLALLTLAKQHHVPMRRTVVMRLNNAHMRLKGENIVHQKVMFVKTKTGKPRSVPISQEVIDAIQANCSGLLFPQASYLDFRQILKAVKPKLPCGQSTHALRHTFATHFMMNGGSIITLQRILGHSRIEQTMSYAHFAPDFLQDAIAYDPLKGKASIELPHSVHT
ncbi:Tyrosine recombinase XerC [Serratia fonticola]|nr:Tyrosine recombinase XerC [Serratia fonticola]